MIHLETLMIWNLTALTAREVGHMFLHESAVFPPLRGRRLHPSGLPLTGQAPLRIAQPLVGLSFAPQKTKASSLALLHTKACFKKGMLACARTKAYLQTTPYKGVAFGVVPSCPAPLRGQCHGANAGQGTQTTSALHKGVFYDRTCSLRSHKSVHSDACALALAQRRVL